MIDTVVVAPAGGPDEPSTAGVSWPAVAAGATVSLALTLVLLAFGTGLGLSVVSPWGNSGAKRTRLSLSTQEAAPEGDIEIVPPGLCP